MKLLVVSDVHGDLDALERAVDAEADADAVIFLGDGLREAEDLQDMRPELKIYSVRGNCDYFVNDVPWQRVMRLGGVNVLITHGHLQGVKTTLSLLPSAAREMGCGVALFGHTHRPTLEERDGILLMNPGTAQRGYAALLTVDEAGKAMGELLSF